MDNQVGLLIVGVAIVAVLLFAASLGFFRGLGRVSGGCFKWLFWGIIIAALLGAIGAFLLNGRVPGF